MNHDDELRDVKRIGAAPAFPSQQERPAVRIFKDGVEQVPANGLTTRQYYAGRAMQGLLAYPDLVPNGTESLDPPQSVEEWQETIGRLAVGYADALIRELAK